MAYDPWADLAGRDDITFGVTRLPKGDGWWMPWVRGIALDDRLDRVGSRCTVAHELAHVDHDDCHLATAGPDGPRQARRQESRADQAAARRLIPLPALAAALATHPDDAAAAAEELDVTVNVLFCRVQNLHPAEEGQLRALLDRSDHAP